VGHRPAINSHGSNRRANPTAGFVQCGFFAHRGNACRLVSCSVAQHAKKPSSYSDVHSPGADGAAWRVMNDAASQKMDRTLQRRWRRPPILLGLVLAYLLVDLGTLAFRTYSDLRQYRDTKYPDSAILLTVAELTKFGHMYLDINQPPYLITPYGPLHYVLRSGPYRLAVIVGSDPVLFLRLTTLIFFLACLCTIFFITRCVTGAGTGLLAALLAAEQMWGSTADLRPDFVGLFFALLSILLLCVNGTRPELLVAAAVSAGLCLLCKQSFVAAPVAVFIWLLWRGQFRRAATWFVVVGLTVIGGYGLFIWREPLSLQHFSALSRPVLEYRGALPFVLEACQRLTAPLFLLGVLYVWRKPDQKTVLLLLYPLLGWCVALLTIPQIGGAANYFYEPTLASAPLAALVLFWLDREQRQTTVALRITLAFLLLYYLGPKFSVAVLEAKTTYVNQRHYAESKARWAHLRSALAGRRLLAMDPAIAVWSSVPEMPDPFLNSTLAKAGTWSFAPIIQSLEEGAYEAVVLPVGTGREWSPSFRGLKHWDPAMFIALRRRYVVACVMDGYEIWTPIGASELHPLHTKAGCVEQTYEYK
jgi:hypothetical protein